MIMRLKFQEQSELKFVSRIIPGTKCRGIMKLGDNETQASETK